MMKGIVHYSFNDSLTGQHDTRPLAKQKIMPNYRLLPLPEKIINDLKMETN